MTEQELHEKYGDTLVGVVKSSFFDLYETFINDIPDNIEDHFEYLPRYQMETDKKYRQVIPYVLVMDLHGRYFVTRRKTGDTRLVNKISLGVGGHIDANEDIYEACHRELHEELNTEKDEPFFEVLGTICSSETEVDSVHAGIVLRTMLDETTTVKETETLEGQWLTVNEITEMNKRGEIESWGSILINKNVLSAIMYTELIGDGLSQQYLRKNHDYGNSFHDTYQKFGIVSGLTRIYDKINRIRSLINTSSKVTDESMMDTVGDAATYCAMLYAEIEHEKDKKCNPVDEIECILTSTSNGWAEENWNGNLSSCDFDESVNDLLLIRSDPDGYGGRLLNMCSYFVGIYAMMLVKKLNAKK